MVLVTNGDELNAALTNAQPGDVIELASGEYGDVTLKNHVLSDYVTIRSQDPNQPAEFETLAVKLSSHLRFENIQVHHVLEEGEPDWVTAFRVDKSDHIQVVDSLIYGHDDGINTNDGQGFLALDSSYILLEGNEFHDLKSGASFGRSEEVEVRDNSFHDLRADGVMFGSVSHVVIEDNTFTSFHPAAGDHPDMIQFWNNGAVQDMEDVVIRNNDLLKGDGDNVQGIFIQGVPPGEVGTFPFEARDFLIEGNNIDGGAAQGIWVYDVENVTIRANIVTEADGAGLIPTIRTINALVEDNTAPGYDDVDSIGTVYGNNVVTQGAIGETIVGTSGDDTLQGGADADTINGGDGNDTLFGHGGADFMRGDRGDDVLWGGDANDELHGGDGSDVLYGGEGKDRLFGEVGEDIIYGDSGDDMLNGGSGSDEMHGGDGNDGFFGGGNDDLIYGEGGNDTVFGDSGADLIYGGAGNDTLYGGSGADGLHGGTGDDTLVGGSSGDSFVFQPGDGNDVITDFSAGQGVSDIIEIYSSAFASADDAIAAAYQDSADTVIDIDLSTSIRLTGVDVSELNTDDFLIA